MLSWVLSLLYLITPDSKWFKFLSICLIIGLIFLHGTCSIIFSKLSCFYFFLLVVFLARCNLKSIFILVSWYSPWTCLYKIIRLWQELVLTLLTYLFPLYPFSTPWKHQKKGFLLFLGGRERVHWEQMDMFINYRPIFEVLCKLTIC